MLILFPSVYVNNGVRYVVGVDHSYEVGEVLGDLFHLLSPGLPHLHSFGDNVVLCSEVVPVLFDLLFQVVIVYCDARLVRFSYICCSLLLVVLTILDCSHGLVQCEAESGDGFLPGAYFRNKNMFKHLFWLMQPRAHFVQVLQSRTMHRVDWAKINL